jgi:hypothetical protein
MRSDWKVIEGSKGIHDGLKTLRKEAEDIFSQVKKGTEHPELVRQKGLYMDAIKRAESYQTAIVAIAKEAKQANLPDMLNTIPGMQGAIELAMERASNAKKLIDNWPKEPTQQVLPGIQKPPANMPERAKNTGDTISRDPNQMEFDFSKKQQQTIQDEVRAQAAPIDYRQMRAAIPRTADGEKNMALFNKTIEDVVGSRKEWKELTKEERRKVYDNVIAHEEPTRKDLGAGATPPELIHYNEPNRPVVKNEWTPDRVKTLQDYVDASRTYGGKMGDIKTAFRAAYPEMEITDQALQTAISKTRTEGAANKGVGHAIKFEDQHMRYLNHLVTEQYNVKNALSKMRRTFPEATFSDNTVKSYYAKLKRDQTK